MKKKTHFVGFFALFLCCGILFSALLRTAEHGILTLLVTAEEPAQPVIILDAGHGGEDGGATGKNGVLEKDLNLLLTSALADLFRMAGYTVVETRTQDRLLCEADTPKGHRKQTDLEKRLEYAQKYPNACFISIHMNTFPLPECQGTQVWYSQNDARSCALAEEIQECVRAFVQPENHRRIKAATSSIYLLRHAKIPAVLVECGFLSSPSECALLCEEAYRQKLALCIFRGICVNLESNPCESA